MRVDAAWKATAIVRRAGGKDCFSAHGRKSYFSARWHGKISRPRSIDTHERGVRFMRYYLSTGGKRLLCTALAVRVVPVGLWGVLWNDPMRPNADREKNNPRTGVRQRRSIIQSMVYTAFLTAQTLCRVSRSRCTARRDALIRFLFSIFSRPCLCYYVRTLRFCW